MSHHKKSLRVAPAEAEDEQIHLKNNFQASESAFQEALGIEPPYEWRFIVVRYDKETGEWVKDSLKTFNSFRDADEYFHENDRKEVADPLHEVEDEKESKGRYPQG